MLTKLLFLISLMLCSGCMNDISFAYSDKEIVNAIFIAEGGDSAKYLYGIRSISYQTKDEARRITLQTIKNNRKRFKNSKRKSYSDFISFLGRRYCPINDRADKKGVNKNWIKNVRAILKKGKVNV